MAATTAYLAVQNPKWLITNCAKNPISQNNIKPKLQAHLTKTTVMVAGTGTGTVLSTLMTSPLAMAAKQIAESPQQDNRGLALLLPVITAVAWVLYNILGPALNQLNRMRSEKGFVLGLGLGGLAAASAALFVPSASAASESVESGGVSSGNSPGSLVVFVAAAVFLEVLLFSTTMKSEAKDKSVE